MAEQVQKSLFCSAILYTIVCRKAAVAGDAWLLLNIIICRKNIDVRTLQNSFILKDHHMWYSDNHECPEAVSL